MDPKDLEQSIYFLLIAVLHDDDDARDQTIEELKENIESVYTFKEAGVLSNNSGIRIQTHYGPLHMEITY